MRRSSFTLVLLSMLCCAGFSQAHAQDALHAVTVPMQLELDRPYIDVALSGADGRDVRAHAWVDTGGGAIMMSADLARRLGAKPVGKAMREEGHELQPVEVPALRIGGMPIELVHARAFVATDELRMLDHTDAEMALPARMLRGHVVVFDYPLRRFTIAQPGKAPVVGTPVKASIGEAGMPVVWLTVAGQSHGFLLDTGGQFCMISRAALDGWMKQKPDWAHRVGAYGPANMLGSQESRLEMLRIGDMQWDPFRIENAGAVSRGVGTYEKWMSGMLEQPVIGSIGGNVLRDFRLTIDYPAGKIYLQRRTTEHPPLATVGITLGVAPQDGYDILGTAAGVHDIRLGDRLLKVEGTEVTQLPYYRVAKLLGGTAGETRTLTLSRDGKPLTVRETVRNVF
jgi:hypothetical protein